MKAFNNIKVLRSLEIMEIVMVLIVIVAGGVGLILAAAKYTVLVYLLALFGLGSILSSAIEYYLFYRTRTHGRSERQYVADHNRKSDLKET